LNYIIFYTININIKIIHNQRGESDVIYAEIDPIYGAIEEPAAIEMVERSTVQAPANEEQQPDVAAGPIGILEIGPEVPAAKQHNYPDDAGTVKTMVEKLVEAAKQRGKAQLVTGAESVELVSGEQTAAKILAAQIATAAKRQKEKLDKRADRQKKRDEFFSTPAVAAAVEKKRHELSGDKDYKQE
jgi:hypothetical protein